MNQTNKQGANPPLDEKTIDRDPIKQFRNWFDAAVASGSRLPNR